MRAPAIRAVGTLDRDGARACGAARRRAGAAGGRTGDLARARPPLEGERFRRATRECLLGVAAVERMLDEPAVDREAIAGERTALLFVTAARVRRLEPRVHRGAGGEHALPVHGASALSAEVAIEFGLTGAYGILIGGAPATVDALWQARRGLARDGRCDRALVLAVETFEECADLFARRALALPAPLVEAAACAAGSCRGEGTLTFERRAGGDATLEAAVRRRAGEHAGLRAARRPGAGPRAARGRGERHGILAGRDGAPRVEQSPIPGARSRGTDARRDR